MLIYLEINQSSDGTDQNDSKMHLLVPNMTVSVTNTGLL